MRSPKEVGAGRPAGRRLAVLAGAAVLLTAVASSPLRPLADLPYRLRLAQGAPHELARRLGFPFYLRSDRDGTFRINGGLLSRQRWVRLREPRLAIEPLAAGRHELEVGLFRLFPVRRVTVEVVPSVRVVPSGQTVGIIIEPEGVVVARAEPVLASEGRPYSPAARAGVQEGDTLLAVDGRPVTDKEEAARLIAAGVRDDGRVTLRLRRGPRVFSTEVPCRRDRLRGRCLIGLWIRDGQSGVGTMTFYEPQTGRFAALGHMVADGGGRPYEVRKGLVVGAAVAGVRPGRPGVPGEKVGVFLEPRRVLGRIERNTPHGLFGQLEERLSGSTPVPVAAASEVRPGPAVMWTVLRGEMPEPFAVEIERVFPFDARDEKGMIVRVTDRRLLLETGGIVQGMSGSPLLQDGRLVGAVTHVFVHDPTRGYGVFADRMLQDLFPPGPGAAPPGGLPAPAGPRRL